MFRENEGFFSLDNRGGFVKRFMRVGHIPPQDGGTRRSARFSTLSVIAFFCLHILRSTFCLAQIPASREAIKLGPVELSGAMDAYYSWNANRPADGINGLHNFDVYNFSPRLNMAELGLSMDPSPFGFELDAGYGDIYKIIDSGEPDSPLRNVLQAFVSYKAKSLHNLQIDAGKFQTSAGVESAETISGWNYSRSLLFVYAQPNYHIGLRSNLEVNRHIELGLQLVNGWNRFLDGNGMKTVAVTSAIKYDHWTLYQDYYYGPERVGAQFYPRGLYDTTLIATLFHNLKADINFDTGYQRKSAQTDTWHGVAGSLEWAPYKHLAFSPRYEWFHDVEGYTTGTPQRVEEVTLTGDYIIAKGFVSRFECRRDMSDEAVFQRSARQAPANQQTTFLVSLIVNFGSLGR